MNSQPPTPPFRVKLPTTAADHNRLIATLLQAQAAKESAEVLGRELQVVAANIVQAWTLIAEETTCPADMPQEECPRCRALLLLDAATDRMGDWTTT